VLSNLTSLMTNPASTGGSSVNLGQGNDLDPPLQRWMVIGGVAGFLVWAVLAPGSMPGHAFFHERGPTQVFCLVMAGMLLTFIIQKWRILQRQIQLFEQFDGQISQTIRSGDLDALSLQAERTKSLVGKRLLRLIDVWKSTGSSFQLERAADADADLYDMASQASFSFPKVLLWAIPILGFIGTVLGMSQSVGSFDAVLSNTDNVDGLKDGLTQVTTGLGTAFDTTYLALVISVILTFPLSACERREERLLNLIDSDVREAVMALSPTGEAELPVPGSAGGGSQAIEQLTGLAADDLGELISDAFEKHLPDPSVLVEPASQFAQALTEATLEKLSPLTTLVRDSVEGVAEARLSLQDQAEVIRTSLDGVSDELNASLNALQPVLNRLENLSTRAHVGDQSQQQLQAMIALKESIERLSVLVENQQQSRWSRFWRQGRRSD